MSPNTPLPERLAASDYLQRLVEQFPELHVPDPEAAEAQIEDVLARLASVSPEWLEDGERLRAFLLEQKARFVLAWAVADLQDVLSTESLGRWQTRFAEQSVQLALSAAWRQPRHKSCLSIDLQPGEDVPGLFILGLGKLGGKDLNFSSDIDLVAFFDRDRLPINRSHGAGDVAARVLKWMTRFLEDQQRDTFLWRVDWRLRPEASATQLAMSVTAGLEYYYFRALPWHRLAMMKARPIAGDRAVGEQFLRDLERFIWRQNLDFRALDELAALKEKIDLEHPELKRQRAQPEIITPEASGVNIKLGAGGIREIEFFANALQLVWGGKRPSLRVPHTATALRELAREQFISVELAERLEEHYWWLRRYENRIQLLSNRQTQNIPADVMSREKFMCLAGIQDWERFSNHLHELRQAVRSEFANLLESDGSVEEKTADLDWPEMNEVTEEIVDMWERGFRGYGISSSQASGLKSLYLRLGQSILESGLGVEESVQRVHGYFRRLPPGGQYFRLLQSAPWLIDGLILPLLYSPSMRTLLEQTPHIIDALLEQAREPGSREDFVFYSPDYESRLERMRRLVNEELYLDYLDLLMGRTQATELQQNLTSLAESALDMALRVVMEQLQIQSPPVCILGMGKLGMAKMAPLSDLDIIYVCGPDQSLESANRFVHRLQTALATPMKEGVVYEMDTRLRPSGRSGPPTITLESFSTYQFERARTWEHQALVTARAVAGDAATGEALNAVRREILTRPRSVSQWRMDAIRMLKRLREQRIHAQPGDVIMTKLRPGGLMESEYLVSCAALRYCVNNPDYADLSYDGLVEAMSEELNIPELPGIMAFWRHLQLWERLLGLDGSLVAAIPERFAPSLFADLGVKSADELIDRMDEYSTLVTAGLERLLDWDQVDDEALQQWSEQPIEWQDSHKGD